MEAAVVTGAASGIGRALAYQLAAEGRKVYAADIAPGGDLEAMGVVPVTVDVAAPLQMQSLAHTASDARLVCLNAGVAGSTMTAPWDVPPHEWEHVLCVNLLGVVNGLRAFVPRLLATGEAAQLLITASLAGLVTFPTGGAYAATKHAVVAVAEQAALALADTPVSVTVLCPALVRTGMSAEGAEPADVAAEALSACRSGVFAVVPAQWRDAVIDRAVGLTAGHPPTLPVPQPAPPFVE